MAEKRDFGGRAFSYGGEYAAGTGNAECRGMTTLDYFAGQALAGILANPKRIGCSIEAFSEDAYMFAAAMIAEKRRRESGNAS